MIYKSVNELASFYCENPEHGETRFKVWCTLRMAKGEVKGSQGRMKKKTEYWLVFICPVCKHSERTRLSIDEVAVAE